LYVLSFIWTTGTGKDFKTSLAEFITRIRICVGAEKELVVWFGIKTPDDVTFLKTLAIDGYIVWSQITRELQQWWVEWLEKYIKTML
jgi:tryptophan synthase alpha subunit